MALSALGLLQQGLDTLRGLREQELADQNKTKGANIENTAGQSSRPVVDDTVDVPKNFLRDSDKGDDTQSDALSPSEAVQRTLGAALDSIVGTLSEVFERLGNTKEAALEFAQNLVNSIKESAKNSDEFSFSFEQSVAQSSRTAISYAGADGVASGTREQSYLAVQSLDIYVNNTTGELSFSFASVQAEVTRTTAVAQSSSAAGANALLGKVMNGLEGGNLLEAGDNLLLDNEGAGLSELISKLVSPPPKDKKEENENVLAPLFRDGPLLTIRDREEIPAKENGDDGLTRLKADLLVPIGQLFNGADGPEFEGKDGVRKLLAEAFGGDKNRTDVRA
ncbi:hypothetical protein WH96_16690 [Kiloniella spongiae]|uniref:Uncharacterized protein n=1 Tax=Kiloniella spongiae TaxID=1489064 RepID=A0A0H2MAI3_9PROT|nr:hypothetical protein [Kiloniella spongiae]KLN59519.1 hypothetical protein WH96_16690 [Kiloniella spongiae]